MPWLVMLGQWVARLFGGWLPLGNKPIGEWLGKILWVGGLFIAFMFIWNKFTAPTGSIKTGSQKADCIYNAYHQQVLRPTFGCSSVKVYEYYKDKKAVEEAKKK